MSAPPDSVTVTVDVEVDPATAFEVFTDHIDSWYVRGPYSWKEPDRALGIRLEPGVGGRLLEVYDNDTGDGFAMGRVTAWEPGVRLAFADLVSGVSPNFPTEVEVRFEPSGAGTRVSLEHRGLNQLPADMADQKRQHGWTSLAHWYADYVERAH